MQEAAVSGIVGFMGLRAICYSSVGSRELCLRRPVDAFLKFGLVLPCSLLSVSADYSNRQIVFHITGIRQAILSRVNIRPAAAQALQAHAHVVF